MNKPKSNPNPLRIGQFGFGHIPLAVGADDIDLGQDANPHLENYDVFVTRLSYVYMVLLAKVKVVTAYTNLGRLLDKVRPLVEFGACMIVVVDHRNPFPPGSTWLDEGVTFTPLNGKDLEYLHPLTDEESALLSALQFRYQYTIEGRDDLRPLLRPPSKIRDNPPVACARPLGKGSIMYLPPSYLLDTVGPSADGLMLCARAIEFLVRDVRTSIRVTTKPSWTSRYLLQKRREISNEILGAQEIINQQTQLVSQLQGSLEQEGWEEDLLFSTDETLEAAVVFAFEAMGLKATAGPRGRADVLIALGDTLLVTEVKGYEFAAKESAINQCARWISEVEIFRTNDEGDLDPQIAAYRQPLSKLGALGADGALRPEIVVKGCVIANTFRTAELEQRPTFPERLHEHLPQPFLTHAQKRGMVVLVSTQVLGLLASARSDDNTAIIRALHTESGLVSLAQNWREFLFQPFK